MHLGTIPTLHEKFWQWLKNQIAQDLRESDAVCEYDCRKQHRRRVCKPQAAHRHGGRRIVAWDKAPRNSRKR
jgi:hypothetical protein